jgi:hypothetical protein
MKSHAGLVRFSLGFKGFGADPVATANRPSVLRGGGEGNAASIAITNASGAL